MRLTLSPNSVHLFLSDIPYGISLDDWDVLHENNNSALLGESPAQKGKAMFARRGKPVNGWSRADRNINLEYQQWCERWAVPLYDKMVEGGQVLIFGACRTIHRAVIALENAGFLTKDVLCWKKDTCLQRNQAVSAVFNRRQDMDNSRAWEGWKLGSLPPVYEPIAWLFKPYRCTIVENLIENGVGAVNWRAFEKYGIQPSDIIPIGYDKSERKRLHPAQKPVRLLEFLIELTTREGQVVLDAFAGSGSTIVACRNKKRKFIGVEKSPQYFEIAIKRIKPEL